MPTPSDRGASPDRTPLEPIRVLRPRRTDALAELMKDMPPRAPVGYESFALPGPPSGAEESTQELPPVRDDHDRSRRSRDIPRGRVPGLRRTAIAMAVTAAAVICFGCALLLAGRRIEPRRGGPAADRVRVRVGGPHNHPDGLRRHRPRRVRHPPPGRQRPRGERPPGTPAPHPERVRQRLHRRHLRHDPDRSGGPLPALVRHPRRRGRRVRRRHTA
ncbi:conserved hypothetical protein [Streptomyces sviceus ATCC 29083]|uniref:Uncharacterized protein n=1 Tax=Streptomyces sviceus (strain ATCC 29083 / DSM 924 / JCM 4929 / NBRC 13980 / NCIMB 11184 / NRRL 5439 / UC 5370) TaxID=463191 RepID=D6XBB6_STRX2|nr:conserved hypothetical protein [Streptomyces sviceus ATCC 29083]